jgi:hypothetical protein
LTTGNAPSRYFTCWPDSSAATVELAGPYWHAGVSPDLRYPLAILARLESRLANSGLHFYFTKDPIRLPEYGKHVVPVLILEERAKIPAYARHVGGILRNLPSRPFLGFRFHPRPGKLEITETFEYLRDWVTHLRSRVHLVTQSPHAEVVSKTPRIFTLPLGYQSQQEVPQRLMAERTLDTFFAGDVATPFGRNNYRYWIPPSKSIARRQLWRVLTQLRDSGEYRIELDALRPEESDKSAYSSYSDRLMNSRICVAPRGSVSETYRFYEGLRAGCLVVANHFPPETFLKGAPVLVVDRWEELPGIMRKYARDLAVLERYCAASLDWWKSHCSEEVIAASLLQFLKRFGLV